VGDGVWLEDIRGFILASCPVWGVAEIVGLQLGNGLRMALDNKGEGVVIPR